MEDEQDAIVGHGSGGRVSVSSFSGNMPSETFVDNMASDNQVEESYEEGGGGEIMVEVVGSDVYVDGFSGHKEGDSVPREDLEGRVAKESEARNFSEGVDVPNEGDGNKVAENDLGFSVSRDEKHFVVTEKVDVGFSKCVDVPVSALPSRGDGGVDDEVWIPGTGAMDGSSSAASAPTEGIRCPSHTAISEVKECIDEAVNKDNTDLVALESLYHPAEAVSDENTYIPERNKALPSSDKYSDSVVSHGGSEATHGGLEPAEASFNLNHEGPQNFQVDSVEEVCLVNDSPRGEHLDSCGQNDASFKAKDECASTNGGDCIENKSVDEKEAFAAKRKDLIVKSDASVSYVHGIKLEPNDRIGVHSHTGPESIHEISLVSESGEAIGEAFDDVLELKDEASNLYMLDLCFVGNDKCLKTDGDIKTHRAHENQVFSNKPDKFTDGGDNSVEDKDGYLEIQDDKEENEPNTTTLSSPPEEDSGKYSYQAVLASRVDNEIVDQNAVILQVKVVDGGRSSEKGEEIDSEILMKSLGNQGNAEIATIDDLSENMHLTAEGACSKVESADAKLTEDHVVSHYQIANSKVGFDCVVEKCVSPQIMKQDVSVQIIETSNHEGDKLESIVLMPTDVISLAAVSDVTQVSISADRTEKVEFPVSSTNISLLDGSDIQEKPGCDMASSRNMQYKSMEADDKSRESNGFHIVEGETKLIDVEEEKESGRTYHEVDAELGTDGPSSETDKLKLSNEEMVKYAGSLRMNQSGYLKAPDNEGHFAQSDLVWGKVRSHPWWPGQIFDPADASEKAVKYYKKDTYLVAYFGDQTFAWNDSSALKPLRSHFSQIEKQNNSEAFQNAVNCALEEVERRVELGLACSCIPEDAYAEIETQVVENTGIREESSRRYGVDQSTQACNFEPDKLLAYVTALAPCASSRADRLDLVITRAQLSAYCRFNVYRSPTEFPSSGGLLEIDADTEQITDEMVASQKHQHIPKDDSRSRKERSLMELLGDREYSPDAEDEQVGEDFRKSISLSSGKKRKALDPPSDESDRKASVHAAKTSTSTSQTPRSSFKIGECIRRVASQLTGSASLVKGSSGEMISDGSPNTDEHSEKQSVVDSAESLSVDEMLLQFQMLAEDPKKRHNIQNNIRAFFLGFRSSIALNRRGRKKKSEQTIGGSGEEFEFDDVNDSYWTDRIVQNYSEEQLLNASENGPGNLQLVPSENFSKAGHKSHSRKRFSSGNSSNAATEVDENAKRRKQESSPAELILNFAERNCVPSEINLNKMFRRFGPLMESETEADRESGCAKVIFKRGSDAEVARNSAEKFNIFGPVLVNYQIGYSPVISVKILPVAILQPQEDAALML